LQPLKDKQAIDTAAMLPATVKAATYRGVMYAAPVSTDGGILFYRKDLVPTPPKTWAEMMTMCSIAKAKGIGCYAGQFFKYEGLTVNTAEAINSAGGTIVGTDGKPTVTAPEAKTGLQNLVTAYANGNIPKQAITFKEEDGRLAFEDGKLLFLRNWPYVYNLAKTDGSSKVKTTFGMATLPGATGPGASSLGGHSAAISVYSKNKATAADFLKFLTSTEQQKNFVTQGSLAPVLTALYDDPALVAKFPYLTPLKASLQNAVPRPVTPFYPAVSKAVQDNSYAAIKGEVPLDTALANMQKAIQAAGGS
jgi:multiple sugar transport system substrate-binding protein